MKTSLARTIENNADHISYDALCKQLLSEKSILAWIMKYCVSECQKMAVEDIIRCVEASPIVSAAPVFPDEKNTTLINGMNTVNTSHDEGTVVFDILFAAMIPSPKPTRLIINVEAQADFSPHYLLPSRAEYYSARLISSQKGGEFTDSHYGDIKKVYSIWVCTNPPKYRENAIYTTSVRMKERSGRMGRPINGYGLQRTVFILLGNEEKKRGKGRAAFAGCAVSIRERRRGEKAHPGRRISHCDERGYGNGGTTDVQFEQRCRKSWHS